MKRTCIIYPVIILSYSLLILVICTPCLAGTFSGNVVDEDGKLVAGLTVGLREYFTNITNSSITDDNGKYSIKMDPSSVILLLLPEKNSGYTIRRVNYGELTLYPYPADPIRNKLTFTVTQNVNIDDIQIVVRKGIKIKGRVLNIDTTPLKNTKIMLTVSGRNLIEQENTTLYSPTELNDDGDFEIYVFSPGYYTLSMKYHNMLAITDEILISETHPQPNIVLMLGGKTNTKPIEEISTKNPSLSHGHTQNISPHSHTDTSTVIYSTFSGQVVDTKGKPVSGYTIGLQPVQYFHGSVMPEIFLVYIPPDQDGKQSTPIRTHTNDSNEDRSIRLDPRTLSITRTNKDGRFSFTDIEYGPLQLYHLSKNIPIDTDEIHHKSLRTSQLASEHVIQSIQIRDLLIDTKISPHNLFLDRFIFGIKSGGNVENVKITVNQQTHIRGRVLYANGQPLRNVSIKLSMKEHIDETDDIIIPQRNEGFPSYTSIPTDNNGDFSVYVDKSGDYIIRIKYMVLSAEAGPIRIENKVQQNELLLKLNGTLIFTEQTLGENGMDGTITPNDEQLPDVWVIHPINNHAYKLIECNDWFDAHLQAIKNDAHLVSINDEDEHQWINQIYGNGFYWIGLNDIEKEGEWVWDGGEPVTYTQWEVNEIYPDDTLTDEEKDYVTMNINGSWQSTSSESVIWTMTRQAILEKDGLVSTIVPKQEELDQ